MASSQVEGANTGNKDGLDELRQELKSKGVYFIVDICRQVDEDLTLKALLEYRKKDILEAIDDINDDESNQHRIPSIKKNKFAKIITEFAAEQQENIAPPNDVNDDPTKHV